MPLRPRCLPGELAFVTRVPKPLSSLLGRVVKVEHSYVTQGKLAWWIDGGVDLVTTEAFMQGGVQIKAGERWVIDSLFDLWLTPLRSGMDLAAELRELQRQQTGAK